MKSHDLMATADLKRRVQPGLESSCASNMHVPQPMDRAHRSCSVCWKAMGWIINVVSETIVLKMLGPLILSPIHWKKNTGHETVQINFLSHRLEYSIFQSRWYKTRHWIHRDLQLIFLNLYIYDIFCWFFVLCRGPVTGSCEHTD
jgi:hypothetical protein